MVDGNDQYLEVQDDFSSKRETYIRGSMFALPGTIEVIRLSLMFVASHT